MCDGFELIQVTNVIVWLAPWAGKMQRYYPPCSRSNISPKSRRLHESFLSQNIFCESKNISCDVSVGTELENEKTESVNENENK